MIKIIKQKDNNRYSVLTETTNKLIGLLEMDIDGFYYFSAAGRSGYWSSNLLKQITSKLDELNKPLEENIKKFFENGVSDK